MRDTPFARLLPWLLLGNSWLVTVLPAAAGTQPRAVVRQPAEAPVVIVENSTDVPSEDQLYLGEAAQHFKAGLALLKAENFAGAASEFELAVWLHPTKGALFNLASCYKTLHQYDKAVQAFARLRQEFGKVLSKELSAATLHHEQEIHELAGAVRLAVLIPVTETNGEAATNDEDEGPVTIPVDGAKIEVDGLELTTPIERPILISPGTKELRVTCPGYEPARVMLTVVSGDEDVQSIVLQPRRAVLTVVANTHAAAVRVDGEARGYTPLAEPLSLAPGEHVVVLDKPGFSAAERRVTLKGDERETLEFNLVSEVQPAVPPPPDVSRPAARTLSALSWLGLGMTVAAAGGTVMSSVLLSHAVQDRNEARSEVKQAKSSDLSAVELARLNLRQQQIQSEEEMLEAATWGFSVGTGVLLAATVVVIVFDVARNKERDTPRAVALQLTPCGAVLAF